MPPYTLMRIESWRGVLYRAVPRTYRRGKYFIELVTLFINGRRIAATNDHGPHPRWAHPLRRNVAGDLRVGRNIIAIQAHNDSGPAGVLLRMLADRQTLLKTDGCWRATGTASGAVAWTSSKFNSHRPRATVEAPYGSGAWGSNLSLWPFQGSPYLARLYFQPLKVGVLRGALLLEDFPQCPGVWPPQTKPSFALDMRAIVTWRRPGGSDRLDGDYRLWQLPENHTKADDSSD